MRVLVTGATGFVGRHLIAALDAAGIAARATVRRGSKPPAGVAEAVPWCAPERPDPSIFEGIDALIHLAAHLPGRYGDPGEASSCLQINALGTLELLLAAAAAGIGQAVCLSSGNLYAPGAGSTPGGGGPADAGPVDEASPTYPSGRAPYYLASKLCGEIWASHLDQTDQIAVAVLRPSAIYGPGMSSGVVRVFVERLSAGLPVVLSDAGRYHSDLVFVGDVVQATIAALRQGARGVFNVGSGHSTSVAELAAALVAILGCDPQLVRSEPAGLHPSPGLAALDIQRALAAGLYAPTPLSVGLSRTLGIT